MSDNRDFINESIDPKLKIGIVMGGYLDEKDHLMSREELHERIFNLQLQLVTANKIIEVLEDMNKFTLETLNEEKINLHMMRQVEQGARQALAEVEKIRNGGGKW